ncbi:Dyp-type peroxidase [Niveibacterium sp. 24ML]|uniref:Dyp-type peroxidase n=1 Tax=Niveibacterium sp. 24ML TaxID=2985512 RepID=UPI00226F7B1E|nr:Dyp-type peroxidase [Niveibacterium sp. 24ML]MCX9156466.1 Dyp-type peroxidase [Niveibacterium sp. 24ML]
MRTAQPGILAPLPPVARYLSYTLRAGADPRSTLQALAIACSGPDTVVGIGASLVAALNAQVPGLNAYPAFAAPGLESPSTPAALWLWLRGDDHGSLLHRHRALDALLAPAFEAQSTLDAFVHQGGRDLTGYEDGTENPQGDEAQAAAIAPESAGPLAGSSFVAVQQWQHSFGAFDAMSRTEQDHCIGRERESNEELDDAPESAHVKRTAQESFAPEAFVLRRSMPWVSGARAGLVFVAFGASLYPFEAQWRRMCGLDDGTPDALFRFTRPISGAYFWCPAVVGGKLDLAPLGV